MAVSKHLLYLTQVRDLQDLADKFRKIKDPSLLDKSVSNNPYLAQKQKLDKFNTEMNRTAVIRYLTIVIDFSSASHKTDLRPSRGVVVKNFISDFIKDFCE